MHHNSRLATTVLVAWAGKGSRCNFILEESVSGGWVSIGLQSMSVYVA